MNLSWQLTAVIRADKSLSAPQGVRRCIVAGGCSYSLNRKGVQDVRITFHVWKYTGTIVIRETKRKAQNVKNNRHSVQE